MRVRSAIFAFVLAAASPPAAAQLSPDAAILPGDKAPPLLDQCSRPSPAPWTGTWSPSAADIAALEAALPAALAEARPGLDWESAPRGWRRQYVGLVRGGRRFVYGNFYPADTGAWAEPDRWRREPVIVCDGGPGFFGVEYDVAARRFTYFGFNGMA